MVVFTVALTFRSGRQVTAYFGLAPKQRSSADSVRLGGISGAGNALVRKLAVEGSWCYAQAGHQPKLMPKGSGVPLEIRMHGRKGSERLLRRREEMIARGMPQAKANAATAAELVRWLWALGTMCREARNRHKPPSGEPGSLRGHPRSRCARGGRRMREDRLGEPRRRRGLRAAGAVSADMRLSRRRR